MSHLPESKQKGTPRSHFLVPQATSDRPCPFKRFPHREAQGPTMSFLGSDLEVAVQKSLCFGGARQAVSAFGVAE